MIPGVGAFKRAEEGVASIAEPRRRRHIRAYAIHSLISGSAAAHRVRHRRTLDAIIAGLVDALRVQHAGFIFASGAAPTRRWRR